MVQMNLPIIKDGKKSILKCDLDTSMAVEERWEENFPVLAENKSYDSYIMGISEIKTTKDILMGLRLIYCAIDFSDSSDKLTWKEFIKIFNFSDTDYIRKLSQVLSDAFSQLFPESKKKD